LRSAHRLIFGVGVQRFPVTSLMPHSVCRFLDLLYAWYTIAPMVLKQAERHQLYYTYVEIMRDCREVNELSQSSLAREVGLSSKYVTLVEGGKRTPSLESLLALMAASQVKRKTAENLVKEILGRFDWRT